MKLFSDTGLSGVRDAIRQKIRAREASQSRDLENRKVIERVVDGTDNRIRSVSGYHKRLHAAVYSALEFADEMVSRIPAAVAIDRKTFATDSHLKAFFVDFPDLQAIFRKSAEVKQFLQDYQNVDTAECCALLCMRKSEKIVMGMGMDGDMLKKDVQQIAVSFSDHLIYTPAPSEAEAREGLRQCLFDSLVTHALEIIEQRRHENKKLHDRRQMLHARLMHLQSGLQQQQPSAKLARDIDNTSRSLEKINEGISSLSALTPQQSLEEVNGVLSRPEQFVRLRRYTLHLDKMGIKIDENSQQPGNRLHLAEVVVGGHPPHVITLAKFRIDELRG